MLNSKLPILVTVSGGRTSAFLAAFIKNRFPERRKLFVFANTGREREETLVFLDRLDQEFDLNLIWLEAKVTHIEGHGTTFKKVDFKSASRKGEPFEEVIRKYGLPSKMYRHCTRELKEKPIHKFAKQVLGTYVTAVGIRSDEKHRLGSKQNYVYPLAEMNIDQRFVNLWWSKQKFNLNLKEHEGNCDFCFLKSKRKRVLLLREGLDVSWWNKMELKYAANYQTLFDARNNVSIMDLIKESNNLSINLDSIDNIDFDCFCKLNG